MKWLGRLFGTQKSIDSVLDPDKGHLAKLGGFIGGFTFTEQEKAEQANKIREWGQTQLEALHPFKVVQRILAGAAAFMWIFVGINYVIAVWLANEGAKESLAAFAFSDYVFWPVVSVFALYFTGGVFNSLQRK